MIHRNTTLAATVFCLLATGAASADDNNWFVRPYVGLSQMSDLSADFDDIDGLARSLHSSCHHHELRLKGQVYGRLRDWTDDCGRWRQQGIYHW